MNLNYAIFRSEPIYTLQDLTQIGSHNKREKQAYKSNPDIKLELKDNNIELVPLADKYVKGFYNITKELKKTTRYYENKVKVINTRIDSAMNEFEEKMKTTKNIPFNKTHVLVEKDTFESMNKVIKESKRAIEF